MNSRGGRRRPPIAATAEGRTALTVALCFGVMVIEGFDIQAMGVAAPALGPELDLSRERLGVALSASNIGLVFGAILAGWLADLVGRKPVLIASVAVFGLFTLLTERADSFEMLFAARLLTGLGFGGALPNVMAISADIADPKRRGLTAALMFCGMPVGGCIVALLSWLGYQGEWRPLFLIGGAIPLLIAPLLFFFMSETRAPDSPVRSGLEAEGLGGAIWLAAIPMGIAAWAGLAAMGGAGGFGSLGAVSPWLGGVLGVLGASLIVHRGALFGGGRAPASVLLWIIFLPTLLILYLVLNWLPSLIAAKGFAQDASLSSVLFNGCAVAGALALGPLVDRFGLRWPLIGAYAALAASLIALAQANSFLSVMALSGAVGFFLLGANYALYGAAAAYYPAELRGRGSGAAMAWGRLGSVAGPLAGGFLLQGGASPGDVALAMTPFAILALLGVLILTILARPAKFAGTPAIASPAPG